MVGWLTPTGWSGQLQLLLGLGGFCYMFLSLGSLGRHPGAGRGDHSALCPMRGCERPLKEELSQWTPTSIRLSGASRSQSHPVRGQGHNGTRGFLSPSPRNLPCRACVRRADSVGTQSQRRYLHQTPRRPWWSWSKGPILRGDSLRLPLLQHRVSTPLLAFLCSILASTGHNRGIANGPRPHHPRVPGTLRYHDTS